MKINKKYINVLIDFDNIIKNDINDTTTIINHIIETLFNHESFEKTLARYEIIIRLYGGWFDKCKLTKRAQDLTALIESNYPETNEKYHYSINPSLTRSLASYPNTDLMYTFRKRQSISRISICNNNEICCTEAVEHIKFLRKIKKIKKCPYCKKESSQLIWQSEQKLVDVMLAMDITYFSYNEQESNLVVVSSDDDFIPAIFQTASLGKKIYHMHDTTTNETRALYNEIAPTENYIEISY